MRKISKISLVAAVAVAGLSTANAQPLEEAIKNVEVNGSVVYRYDNFHNAEKKRNGVVTSDRNADSGKNNYKIGLNLSSKVNDYVKFNSRFIVGSKGHGGFATLDSKRDGGADGQADVTLSNAYFALTAIPNTVVNIGKQGLATPYTVAVDQNGNEQTGTGILALTNIDVVTLGAGYFNNTNLDSSFELNATQGRGLGKTNKITAPVSKELVDADGNSIFEVGNALVQDNLLDGGSDIYVATAQADLDYVKLEAWYTGMQDTFNSYTLAATGNVELAENAKLGLEARYVNLKLDKDFAGDLERKNDMFRFAVDGKFDIVNARVAFTKTGKEGGLTALDQDAKNTSLGWAISSNGVANAKYWQAALGADILDNLNFTVHYGNLKAKESKKEVLIDDVKAQEVYGQLTYKMSKNLSTYLRYGQYKEKEYTSGDKVMDQKRGRIQVAYTF